MHQVPTAERYGLSHPRSKSHGLFIFWILLFCRYTVTVSLSVNTTIPPITVRLKELIGSQHATRTNGQRGMYQTVEYTSE